MRKKKKAPPTPKDLNQLASFIIEQAAIASSTEPHHKNPAAVALGRLGGLKGGKARAAKLSPEKRREIARKAAEKRWNK